MSEAQGWLVILGIVGSLVGLGTVIFKMTRGFDAVRSELKQDISAFVTELRVLAQKVTDGFKHNHQTHERIEKRLNDHSRRIREIREDGDES